MKNYYLFQLLLMCVSCCNTITYTMEDDIYYNEYSLDSIGVRIDYIKEYDSFYYIIAGKRAAFLNDNDDVVFIHRIISPKNYDEDSLKAFPKIEVGKYYNLRLHLLLPSNQINRTAYVYHEYTLDYYGKKIHIPGKDQKDGCLPWISTAENLRGLYLLNNNPDPFDPNLLRKKEKDKQ